MLPTQCGTERTRPSMVIASTHVDDLWQRRLSDFREGPKL
jgi:hypothetical protein